MTVACATRPSLLQLAARETPAASREGRGDADWLAAINDLLGVQRYTTSSNAPLEERLSTAFYHATHAVREQIRSLDPDEANNLVGRLEELLSADAWDDDDEILKIGSLKTMIRAVVRLEMGVGDLTMARSGNLVATWSRHDHVLRVEAHSRGTVAWTILHPQGAQPRHEHTPEDTLENLAAVAAEHRERAGGNPGRR